MESNASTASWVEQEGPIRREKLPNNAVAITMHLSPKYIVVTLDDQTAHVFDPDGELLHVLSGHKNNVWSLALNDDTLLCGEVGGIIQSWELVTGKLTHTLTGHSRTVRCLVFTSPTSFISASRDATLKLWSLSASGDADSSCLATLSGHTAPIVSLAFDPTSRLAVSGSQDGTYRVWDLAAQGTCVTTLACHEGGPRTVAFAVGMSAKNASREPRVVTAGIDGKVKVWNALSGAQTAALDGHTAMVGHILIVANGAGETKTMVTAGADGAIRVWEVEDEWRLRWARKKAHEYAVTSVKTNGRYVVSGGADGLVRVWELETGRMVKQLGDNSHTVYGVAFKEGGHDGIVVLWRQGSLMALDIFPL